MLRGLFIFKRSSKNKRGVEVMNTKKTLGVCGLVVGFLTAAVVWSPLGYGEDIEREYYKNGQVKSEWSYKKGVLDGPYKAYYESGRLKAETVFKNGKIDAAAKEYDEEGRLIS